MGGLLILGYPDLYKSRRTETQEIRGSGESERIEVLPGSDFFTSSVS